MSRSYLALFDFDGSRKVASCPTPWLYFKKGDVIAVSKRQDDFLFGKLATGSEGWFPKVVVKRQSGESSSKMLTMSANSALGPSGASTGTGAATSPGSGSDSGRSTLARSSPNTAPSHTVPSQQRRDLGSSGLSPSPLMSPSVALAGLDTPQASPDPKKKTSQGRSQEQPAESPVTYLKSVKAISDWNATDASHLSLVKGEVLAVTGEEGAFYVGTNLQGRTGKFPSSKVTIIASGTDGSTIGRKSVVNRSIGHTRHSSSSSKVSCIKHFVARQVGVLSLLSKKNLFSGPTTQRNRVIRELIETERAYQGFLQELVAYKTAMEKGPFCGEVPTLFGNLDALVSVSNRLLAEFNQVTAMWSSSTSSIASPLLATGPFLMCFADYATTFNNAIKRLDTLNLDPKFQQHLKDIRKADSQPLPALAVMPVQRVPRYKLLTEEIIRHTPENHPDMASLQEALTMVSALAVSINEMVRSSEKTQALLEEGKHKEVLSEYVTGDRTVVMEASSIAEVVIDECKSGLVSLKATVFLLSDSILLILNHAVKDTRDETFGFWVEQFSRIFWPTKLLFVRRVDSKRISVVGPFFHITLKFKKDCDKFFELLSSEVAKHTTKADTRTGAYVWDDYKYEGDWNKDGLMHGKGNMAIGNGCIYSGEWENGQMTGSGKMKLSSGDLLIGTFERGLLHGQGMIDYANGDKFSGTFEKGVRVGKGEFRSTSASTAYSGIWSNDNAHGEGVLTVGNAKYVGTFDNGNFVKGSYVTPEGVTYSGSFSNFRFLQGAGKIVYADGSVYNGNVERNMKEGSGTMDYSDGSRFEGDWKNDVFFQGTFTGGAGHQLKSYTGTFDESGSPHGKNVSKAVFADGSTFKGTFLHGTMDKGELLYPSGMLVQGKFRNGNHLRGKTLLVLPTEEELEGLCDDATNLLYIKNRPFARLPISRPSFPLHLSIGTLGKK